MLWEVNAIINIYHYHIIIAPDTFLILTGKKIVLKILPYLWHPQEKILLFILQPLFGTRGKGQLLFYSQIHFHIVFSAFTFFSLSNPTKYMSSLTNILFSFLSSYYTSIRIPCRPGVIIEHVTLTHHWNSLLDPIYSKPYWLSHCLSCPISLLKS